MLNIHHHILYPITPWQKPSSTATIGTVCCSSPTGDGQPSPAPPSTVGRIKRLVLSPEGRTKLNTGPDRDFYSFPRFVNHVDDGFIQTLTDLYRQRLRPDSEILDLMSSWLSHLPPEVAYKRVIGHGMNAAELSRNPRLDHFFIKDLNDDQELQMKTSSLDAVICTVSVQYLRWPEKVFTEVLRVLRPGGVFIVSFSNRMFYEKAVAAWRDATPYGRTRLVVEYFQCVDGFTEAEVVKGVAATTSGGGTLVGRLMRGLGLAAGSADPFYAVIAYRNFKPL